jgi:hypothetical protein
LKFHRRRLSHDSVHRIRITLFSKPIAGWVVTRFTWRLVMPAPAPAKDRTVRALTPS